LGECSVEIQRIPPLNGNCDNAVPRDPLNPPNLIPPVFQPAGRFDSGFRA